MATQVTEKCWEKIRSQLIDTLMPVQLLIDGYTVTLKLNYLTSREYIVTIFVDGKIPYAHVKEGSDIGKRFLSLKETYKYSYGERLQFIKLYGEKVAMKMGAAEKIRFYELDWRSLEDMQMYFVANNESIELLNDLVGDDNDNTI